MKKNSKLNRYKDPLKQIGKIDQFNRATYRNFTFRLHKVNDKEMIEAIDSRIVSLPELIKNWYKSSK